MSMHPRTEHEAKKASEAIGQMIEELREADANDAFGDVILDGQTGADDRRSVAFFLEGLRAAQLAIEALGPLADAREAAADELCRHREFCVESLWPEDIEDMEASDWAEGTGGAEVTYGQVMDEDELLRTAWRAVKAYRNYIDAESARAEFVAEAAEGVVGGEELRGRIARARARG